MCCCNTKTQNSQVIAQDPVCGMKVDPNNSSGSTRMTARLTSSVQRVVSAALMRTRRLTSPQRLLDRRLAALLNER